jgi:excisionase family DNA binding protein
MEDRLLTAQQVMNRLNVGRSLVYDLAADGTIPSVRIRSAGSRRGALRFFASDVEEYLARLKAESRGMVRAEVDPDAVRQRILRGRGR